MSFLWSFGTPKKENIAPAPSSVPNTPSQQSFKAMSNAFRKGVQYNMKIVLRGDVMTGKSNLFHRLQGSEFEEAYASTPQIQVANIPWHYKDSNDIVKIEIWDVVDKAHNKQKSNVDKGIKLEHNSTNDTDIAVLPSPATPEEQMGLDASTVNVYRNSHGAILLFDTTKPWTFDYVNKELGNVPESMAVLVLGNFCDKAADRKVDLDTIHSVLYQHNQDRIKKGAIKPNLIRYAETSMQTGLGLKYIYEYLGVPFLQLMIESLNKQLELKAVEIVDLLQDLDVNDDVPETMQRRRGQDNFSQPNVIIPTKEATSSTNDWYAEEDDELNEIAIDHPSMFKPETPPPPTAPVAVKKKKDSVVLTQEVITADYKDEDELNDDWFGQEEVITLPSLNKVTVSEDEDDQVITNPMVTGDEDVEPTYYYNSGNNNNNSLHIRNHEEEQVEQEEESKQEQVKEVETYQQPVFKSELNDVWSRGLRRLSGPEIISDSEDEDNRVIDFDSSSAYQFNTKYEEIGGTSNENPWSIGHPAEEQQETWHQDHSIIQEAEEEEAIPKTEATKKKKKSSSSSKKKSSSGKKKKSSK